MEKLDKKTKRATWPLPPNDKITSKIPTKTVEYKGNRYYTQRNLKSGESPDYLMSVTTWENAIDKGIGFHRWLGNSPSYDSAMDYANKRAWIGTATHALCMYLAWGQEVDTSIGFYDEQDKKLRPIPDEIKMRLSGFIDFFDDYMPVTIATEISLFNNSKYDDGALKYPYAGTADNIFMIDGKLWMVDIKTGAEYPKAQRLQLTAYKILYDTLYAEETGPIDQLACLFLKSNGKYKLVKHKFIPEAWDALLDFGHFHYSDLNGKFPVVKEQEELPRIYTLKAKEEDGKETEDTK